MTNKFKKIIKNIEKPIEKSQKGVYDIVYNVQK